MNLVTSPILRNAITAHRAGDWAIARQHYLAALAESPDRPEILFNFGLLLMHEAEFNQAADCFAQIIAVIPHHLQAHYYLANCYFSLQKLTEAKIEYEWVISQNPGHVDALNNLGALLLHEQDYTAALPCFAAVLTAQPEHLEARHNIATLLLSAQRPQQAAEQFAALLKQRPQDIGARYSYGLALLDSEQFAEAIIQFKQIYQQQPDHLDALSNLGIAYLKAGNKTKAQTIFAEVLARVPDNAAIDYLYRALTGQTPPAVAPPVYVKNLFEQYAHYYESHMLHKLHYQVPQQLIEFWGGLADYALDLGCGTGLSGQVLRHKVNYLVGIDLSPRMLILAKNQKIYNELIEGELLAYLQTTTTTYALLFAADTFNYFGDFIPLFHACYHALQPNGWLLFSAEVNHANAPWQLQTCARYCHQIDYITQIAQQQGFINLRQQLVTLREQAGQPVTGWLIAIQKP